MCSPLAVIQMGFRDALDEAAQTQPTQNIADTSRDELAGVFRRAVEQDVREGPEHGFLTPTLRAPLPVMMLGSLSREAAPKIKCMHA
jgi:hypothetical protein